MMCGLRGVLMGCSIRRCLDVPAGHRVWVEIKHTGTMILLLYGTVCLKMLRHRQKGGNDRPVIHSAPN